MIKTKQVTPHREHQSDVVFNMFASSRPHFPTSFCLEVEDRDLSMSLWLTRRNLDALFTMCCEALELECDENGEFIEPLAVGDER